MINGSPLLKRLFLVLLAAGTFGLPWGYCQALVGPSLPALADAYAITPSLGAIGPKETVPPLEMAAVQSRQEPLTNHAGGEKALDLSANLVKNSGLELQRHDSVNKPAAWETLTELHPPFADLTAEYRWEGNLTPSGRRALTIKTSAGDKEAGWVQMITGLQPGQWYRATAWLKIDHLEPNNTVARGAAMVADFFIPGLKEPITFNSKLVSKDQNWSKQELTFVVPEKFTRMALRLSSVRAKGTISWADVSLVPLSEQHRPDRNLAELPKPGRSELDSYGGWKKIVGQKTGFFHTEKIGNRWWLITPEGHGFIVAGVFHEHLPLESAFMVNVKRLYHDKERWFRSLAQRLADWGFNTFVCLPPLPGFAYEVFLSPKTQVKWNIDPAIRVNFVTNLDNPYTKVSFFPDVFDQKFQQLLEEEAQHITSKVKSDPWLLGYSMGGELPWDYFLLDMFLALPAERAGKKAAVAFLQDRYQNQIPLFNAAAHTQIKDFKELLTLDRLPAGGDLQRLGKDRAAFVALVAEIYFKAGSQAVKKFDPNHMILGARFGGPELPEEVLKTIGKYVDVVSYQPYDPIAPMESLAKAYQFFQKPILITEFSFRAVDSGLPNSLGGGFTLPTQEDRGRFFQRYVSYLLSSPFAVGYVWYRYVDEVPTDGGAFRLEDCNCGLVNKYDAPYTKLVEKIKFLNQRLYYLASRQKIK